MTRRQPAPPYTGPCVEGIDVSHWQGGIDWGLVPRDRIKFVIARLGDGKDLDSKFEHNWEGAKNHGFCVGSYIYFRADRGGELQATNVCEALVKVGFEPGKDIPPAIDLESGTWKNLPGGLAGGITKLPTGLVVEEALEFLHQVEETLGVRPLVYTGQAFHWSVSQEHPDLAEDFAEYPLWVPSYGSRVLMPVNKQGELHPWAYWTIWQYSNKGQIPGISTPVDMNKFRGNEDSFDRFIKGTVIKDDTVKYIVPTVEVPDSSRVVTFRDTRGVSPIVLDDKMKEINDIAVQLSNILEEISFGAVAGYIKQAEYRLTEAVAHLEIARNYCDSEE